MGDISIPYIICSILAFVPAIVLHEMGHAFAAYKLGDPTAASQGRLSFNPLKHIDPFGTVIMPLMLMAMNMPIFGYAKPVPYNPRYFENPRKGDLIVGLAGPAANLIQALIGSLVAWACYEFLPLSQLVNSSEILAYVFLYFLPYYVLINLFLMFFNLLPIPPLDGSSIFAFFCPVEHLDTYYKIQQYALPIFLLAVIVVPEVLHVDPIGAYLNFTAYNLFGLVFPY
ncbi:MAG: site-2 protease family protein [Eggerthellaceae bacterium]|jgi:Zn-dependent protease|nr:site-2 protease family protein [Eggerthellaceae bacterium]